MSKMVTRTNSSAAAITWWRRLLIGNTINETIRKEESQKDPLCVVNITFCISSLLILPKTIQCLC